ncbi:MAG: lipid-A-disaccharide synthase, partial [Candidatus Aminicenantes bacterium]|nr:lipid-A-disaccharide synthase [Candidatus Aminicenantes bacterium]
VQILYPVTDLSVMGIFELFSHLPRLKRIFDRIKKEVRTKKPAAALLIDSPDFNLRMAKVLKRESVPVLYYISPTVWAWRKGRLKTIKKFVDRMMLIFPFEETFYRENGVEGVYVGHPLCESLKTELSREEFLCKHGIRPDKKIICLMPGSRMSEIKYHMPILMKSTQKMAEDFSAECILVLAEGLDERNISEHLQGGLKNVHVLKEDRYESMAYSDLILTSCGTANLEAALLGTPFITFYRISPWSYKLGLPFVKTRTYSIVNILAGRRIVPELIQTQFTVANLLNEAARILESHALRTEMSEQFKRIRDTLGTKKASENASAELERILEIGVK